MMIYQTGTRDGRTEARLIDRTAHRFSSGIYRIHLIIINKRYRFDDWFGIQRRATPVRAAFGNLYGTRSIPSIPFVYIPASTTPESRYQGLRNPVEFYPDFTVTPWTLKEHRNTYPERSVFLSK